jgi:hypothetical protein
LLPFAGIFFLAAMLHTNLLCGIMRVRGFRKMRLGSVRVRDPGGVAQQAGKRHYRMEFFSLFILKT